VKKSTVLATCALGLMAVAAVGQAVPGAIAVNANIAVSTTWTSNNVYKLEQQIYVLPGATLTIEAGTVIASTTNLGGSLAVTRGGNIQALGTAQKPIVFTSSADWFTWTAGNPQTGTYRLGANEWGNLTIMGSAYISEDPTTSPGNVATANQNNVASMEGLVAAVPGDPNVVYGGGNDDDDSGTLSYVSFRYGGKVIGLNNELNGLSLGGIGRETDIHHVEIINNVDDGIEIWGGTVNLKYVSIWNVGDDSLDIDQGWRGKAQFGLIVQGYSAAAAQGSGVGDNCIEVDGAELASQHPVTTASLYNFTVLGQPTSGDDGVTYRDGARLQIKNSIFMDLGERLIQLQPCTNGQPNGSDCEGNQGYGHLGSLTWADTWTTPYNVFFSAGNLPAGAYVNAPAPQSAGGFYQAQKSGNLNEIKDCVFYNNNLAAAYTEAIARGVLAAGPAPANDNQVAVANPLTTVTRGAPVVAFGSLVMQPVTFLDPTPAPGGPAETAVAAAPADGFFTPALYRGAFAPGAANMWLTGWTATYAYGMTPQVGVPQVTFSQPGAGGLLTISGRYLVPNANCIQLFTINNPCPAGVGTGPIFGLCATTPLEIYNLLSLFTLPPGTVPVNFFTTTPTENYVTPIPPGLTIEAVNMVIPFSGSGAFLPVIGPNVRYVTN
jgi:hypothetical protein